MLFLLLILDEPLRVCLLRAGFAAGFHEDEQRHGERRCDSLRDRSVVLRIEPRDEAACLAPSGCHHYRSWPPAAEQQRRSRCPLTIQAARPGGPRYVWASAAGACLRGSGGRVPAAGRRDGPREDQAHPCGHGRRNAVNDPARNAVKQPRPGAPSASHRLDSLQTTQRAWARSRGRSGGAAVLHANSRSARVSCMSKAFGSPVPHRRLHEAQPTSGDV